MNGSQTSEFKVTLVSQLISMVLVSLGIIDVNQVDDVTQHIMILAGAIGTIITSSLYIYSRLHLKSKTLDLQLKAPETPTNVETPLDQANIG